MRAIQIAGTGGPEVLRIVELPDPMPTAGQVLVRIEAVGVNYIEMYQRSGIYQVAFPNIPGSEAAGTVIALGAGVTDLSVGDRVAYQGVAGAYAELAAVPADRVVRIPDGVTTEQAAAVMLQGMTAHYLTATTYPLSPGDTCLIHAAAGGVGLLFCQIASARGARVIGTTSTEAKAQLARDAGASDVILYTTHDFVTETRALTGGRGVQVVYDSVGKTTFEKDLDVLVTRGMLVSFGQSSGPAPSIDPLVLLRKGSLFLTRPMLGHYVVSRPELLTRANDVLGWVRDGRLHVRIDRTIPLADAAEAHRALESRRTAGKVLLKPGR
jgi:NADPH2:quinone reductase